MNPSYLQINSIRRLFKNAVALTDTFDLVPVFGIPSFSRFQQLRRTASASHCGAALLAACRVLEVSSSNAMKG